MVQCKVSLYDVEECFVSTHFSLNSPHECKSMATIKNKLQPQTTMHFSRLQQCKITY